LLRVFSASNTNRCAALAAAKAHHKQRISIVTDIIRLIEGLIAGDPTARFVLIFTLMGTVIIVGLTEVIRRSRR
jgi:hypothetical protein